MSADRTRADRIRTAIASGAASPARFRMAALASAAVLTLTYLSVLYHVVDVVGGLGGVAVFAAEVVAAIVLAVALSRTVSVRLAVALGFVLLVGGLAGYLLVVPGGAFDVHRQVSDTIALLTGLSVLRMAKVGIWVLGFAPGPLFASWYLFLRRRYVSGTLVGGAALGFFVLTGDADTVLALVGALGAVGAVGFGDLDRGDDPDHETTTDDRQETELGWQLSRRMLLMAIVTTTVSLVPGGEARPLLPDRGSTMEASLFDAADRVEILGSISLSPTVRFTVTAESVDYWRVGAYDRYTGSGWVRTGDDRPYRGSLSPPESDDLARVRQTYEVESRVGVMPAAWKPIRVGVGADRTRVTDLGGLRPAGSLTTGDQYSVESWRADASTEELRDAGSDYPAAIEERYLQLPASTPDRVAAFTADLTAEADNPYDTARAIERWLSRNKGYSLRLARPDGNIAASFLFGMDRGYCTYFATTMVAMLRTQGVPARFVVGYTPGQQVTQNRWVVRGLDAHAWVEAYFPGHGWIRFDPTPAGPRRAAEDARLEQARAADAAGVDTGLSEGGPSTPSAGSTTPATADPADDPPTITGTGANATDVTPVGAGPEGEPRTEALTPGAAGGGGISLPPRETVLYGLLVLAGAATAAHRVGLVDRAYRELWLRREPDGPPARVVEGAFERVEYLLERRYRARRTDETAREYLSDLRASTIESLGGNPEYEDRVLRLLDLYERARYAGRVTPDDAAVARDLLDALVE